LLLLEIQFLPRWVTKQAVESAVGGVYSRELKRPVEEILFLRDASRIRADSFEPAGFLGKFLRGFRHIPSELLDSFRRRIAVDRSVKRPVEGRRPYIVDQLLPLKDLTVLQVVKKTFLLVNVVDIVFVNGVELLR
jgi:hypothetical protein